ncbi:hypothetical protein BD560DRAFT_461897 [Blakeslea trispora]|nr:hypothetical protein BD560DRAFT_461897 [Blakeslea trispora]
MNNNTNTKLDGRGESYTKEEDIFLCNAWVTVVFYRIRNTDKKNARMWENMHTFFSQCKPDNRRTFSSLQKRWAVISKEVALYSCFYEKAERKASRGANEVDIVSILCL